MQESSSDDSDSSTDLSDGPVVLTREQTAARRRQRQRDQDDSRSARDMLNEANEIVASVQHRAQQARLLHTELVELLEQERTHTGPGREERIRHLEAEVEEARVFAEQERRVLQQANDFLNLANTHLQRIFNRRGT